MSGVSKTSNDTTANEIEADSRGRRQFANTLFRDLSQHGETLTDTELMLLIDATSGSSWRGMLEHSKNAKICLTGFRDDPAYEKKWDVDGKALAAKIEALTDAEACFLGGFLRGWWQRQGEIE